MAVIKKRLESGEKSRTRLARWVCRRFQLYDLRGKPRVSSCLKALRDLEREAKLQLPPPVLNIVKHWRVRRHSQGVAKPKEVPAEVGQIRDLQLSLVDPQDGEQMRTWNELMVREHPQGQRRLVGRQLRYLVGSATRARSTACWPFLMRGEATPHRPFPRIRSPGLAICGFAANTVMA